MGTMGLYTEAIYSMKEDALYSSDIFILFFKKLFPDDRINLIGRVLNSDKVYHYKIDKKDASFYKLSGYKNIPFLFFIFPLYILFNFKHIKAFVNSTDHLFVATPSPVSILLILLFRFRKKKITIFVRQDTRELVRHRYKTNFFPLLITNILESIVESIVKTDKKIIVFAFGSSIKNRFLKYSKNVFLIADSRYSASNIMNDAQLKQIPWNKEVKLLFIGRLEKGKGIENLINVFASIVDLNYSLTIIGDGNLIITLKDMCNSLQIMNHVTFTGFVPFGEALFELIKKHHIHILPSLSEGLPQVVLEAMACGLLTIGTDAGGIQDIIINNQNGFIYDKNSPDELKNVLIRLHTSKFNNIPFCKAALQTAFKYSNESNVALVHSILLNK